MGAPCPSRLLPSPAMEIMGVHIRTIVRIVTPMISIAGDGSRADTAVATADVVPPRGFEPLISTLKGWRPRPLDDGGTRVPG